LIERNQLYYEKDKDIPFTGNVIGKIQGKISKGQKNGTWKIYYENGRLMFDSKTYERFFRNGMLNFNKIDGQTVSYDEHGIRNENRLFERRKELMY
jgi:antitoxin component YwqK of YwqJK toxin-antitoxin module